MSTYGIARNTAGKALRILADEGADRDRLRLGLFRDETGGVLIVGMQARKGTSAPE